ncbi:hypothetical protein [Hazenella coriacea]|uniref:Uncharacterized protein n=1 Tax=Hazenella coriacea TaxID=1179467 RepID=A0A4V2UVA0_9BACL|nr:hypothetical protein [Hazenella coriacea]TCS95007.1 hypothetical protein EDD58_103432 [Hazenella coriacea]
MNPLSVKEISSLLSTRWSSPIKKPNNIQDQPPHHQWDATSQAVLVILWGLLIYPQLDPDLQSNQRSHITVDELIRLFGDYVGQQESCMNFLLMFKQHDYIRLEGKKTLRIIPGTGLLASIDAAKMYRYFRNSVLSRRMFHYQQGL